MEKLKRPPREKQQQPKGGESAQAAGRPDGEEGQTAEKSIEGPSREEVIKTWTNPVTNQDEQEKITNAGGDDIPNQEV